MYLPVVSDWRKFDWSCKNHRQVERVLRRLVPRWRREKNWTRILGARACTTSFRGCSCHPSDSKSQKLQVLMKSQQNCSKQEEIQYSTQCTEFVAIWKTGEWPEEWTFSTFIPLPKKGDLKRCANYRKTALVSYASKIDPSSDHNGKDPSEDRNTNCRRTGGIPKPTHQRRQQRQDQGNGERRHSGRAAYSFRISNWSRWTGYVPYLGSLITKDGECTTEFHTRLNRGQAIVTSLQKMWKSHSIPISTTIGLMKALVCL